MLVCFFSKLGIFHWKIHAGTRRGPWKDWKAQRPHSLAGKTYLSAWDAEHIEVNKCASSETENKFSNYSGEKQSVISSDKMNVTRSQVPIVPQKWQ